MDARARYLKACIKGACLKGESMSNKNACLQGACLEGESISNESDDFKQNRSHGAVLAVAEVGDVPELLYNARTSQRDTRCTAARPG